MEINIGRLVRRRTTCVAGTRVQAGRPALIAAVIALIVALFAPLAAPTTVQAQEEWRPPSTVYIEQTGHTLDQLFLDLWRDAGGAGAFGYPITPEIEQPNGHIIQYLQYARFEYWPEGDENGNTVKLGKIGEELRPINLRRSVSNFAGNTKKNFTSEAANVTRAWLPVSETDVPADNPDIRYIAETKHTIWGGFRSWWENNGEDGYLGNPLSEEYNLNGTAYQIFERGMLSWNETDGIRLVPVGQVLADKYKLPQDPVAQGDIPTYSEDLFVPPPPPKPKRAEIKPGGGAIVIDINLSTQYMTVYQGNNVVLESYVSTGRPGFDTPTGTFYVHTKYEADDMEGVIGGEYYNVPQVPDVLYFSDRGHAIHGAYWHNNFGAVMSHGCVNLPTDVAEYLYSFTPVGTKIVIHY